RAEGLVASCRVRRLMPSLLGSATGAGVEHDDASLTALDHAQHITSLTLHCARQLVFESQIEPGMFGVFPRLETLKILGCKITTLPKHALAGLPHLRVLVVRAHHHDWRGASLDIHPQALFDAGHLEELDLTHNALWTLPGEVLCRLPSLHTLNLTHNHLHDLLELGLSDSDMQKMHSSFACTLQ
ncbi:unnamed protein product, partial [Meganyctiphanes norvegica]